MKTAKLPSDHKRNPYCGLTDYNLLTMTLAPDARISLTAGLVLESRYRELLKNSVCYIVGMSNADEVVQCAMVKVYIKLAQGELNFDADKGDGSMRNFFLRIVKNEAISFCRKYQRIVYESDLVAGDDDDAPREFIIADNADPLSVYLASEKLRFIDDAVDKLPKLQQQAFRELEMDDKSDVEFADEYNLNINTVRARRFQARRSVQKYLDRIYG